MYLCSWFVRSYIVSIWYSVAPLWHSVAPFSRRCLPYDFHASVFLIWLYHQSVISQSAYCRRPSDKGHYPLSHSLLCYIVAALANHWRLNLVVGFVAVAYLLIISCPCQILNSVGLFALRVWLLIRTLSLARDLSFKSIVMVSTSFLNLLDQIRLSIAI